MAPTSPYTFVQCPCSSNEPVVANRAISAQGADEDQDGRDFDPRAPRSNYSLFPLEELLYCEDCQQIRCQRCVLEEIVTWYCPNCLFEVPSSSVKSEGTRCTRSCFECPCCTAPLSVTTLETSAPPTLRPDPTPIGPYILSCSYCAWNSKEIGVHFEKPNNIHSQLSKVKNGGERIILPSQHRPDQEDSIRRSIAAVTADAEEDMGQNRQPDNMLPEIRFQNLRLFYQSQLAETSATSPLSFGAEYGFGSPSSLSRIMGMYTSGSFSAAKSKKKSKQMREASSVAEGLVLQDDETSLVKKLEAQRWEGTASYSQRSNQISSVRFLDELRPVPYLLRTKRSKRCKTCRHILTKPESKISNTRYRIRLVAVNYIPSNSIKPLASTSASPSQFILVPHTPTQFILTLKNPLFDPVKITLATPSHTPGRISSKVTILCPQFEIGANTDVWDEALAEGSKDRRSQKPGDSVNAIAEAGKVWERGRNWSSVVVEVVAGSLRDSKTGEKLELLEDEDVLEIPVFVRVEWEADAAGDEANVTRAKDGELREKRELAYWCVLGVGNIVES